MHVRFYRQKIRDAISAIHLCGLKHGDIHEGNLLFSGADDVRIIDFTHSSSLDGSSGAEDFREMEVVLHLHD